MVVEVAVSIVSTDKSVGILNSNLAGAAGCRNGDHGGRSIMAIPALVRVVIAPADPSEQQPVRNIVSASSIDDPAKSAVFCVGKSIEVFIDITTVRRPGLAPSSGCNPAIPTEQFDCDVTLNISVFV